VVRRACTRGEDARALQEQEPRAGFRPQEVRRRHSECGLKRRTATNEWFAPPFPGTPTTTRPSGCLAARHDLGNLRVRDIDPLSDQLAFEHGCSHRVAWTA
jgi:hypothetical protein